MGKPEQPPDYVLLSPQSKEALLSQWGVTSPSQRELFHKLCAQRRADIDPSPWPKNDLEGLMTKLRDARVGLIITKKTPEGRKWHKVLLTDEGSPRFWYHFISELYQNMLENGKTLYLKASFLRERGMMPPENLLTRVASDGVHREFMAEAIEAEKILSIRVYEDECILCAKDYPILINLCYNHIRQAMQNQANQVAVARLLKSNLNELVKYLNSKDAGFWKLLTQVLVQNRQDLVGDPRLKWDQQVFYAALLLGGMVEAQLQDAQRQKEEEKQREADMQIVIHALFQSPEGSLSPEEIKAVLAPIRNKYGSSYGDWESEFYRRFTTSEPPSTSGGLPPVIVVGETWIHRDKLFAYFVRHWDRLRSKIKAEMAERLKRYIESGGHSNDFSFAQSENFENTLRELIEKEDPEIGWILKRPRILAEAAIAIKKGVEAAQPLLEKYFKPGTLFFKRLSVMLDLDPEELYQAAFTKLSWLTQFWLFLSGKRDAFLKQLLEITPRLRGVPKAVEGEMKPLAAGPSPTVAGPREKAEPGVVGSRPHHARKEAKPAQRIYTEREKNKAWKQFAENIRKSPPPRPQGR